jgi:hypothetical protein
MTMIRAAFALVALFVCLCVCAHCSSTDDDGSANGPDAGEAGANADATSTQDASGDGSADNDGAADGGTTGVYVLYEKFNAMPTAAAPGAPWKTDGSVIVREVPFAADKSAEISKPTTATSVAARLATSFPPQSGRVVFEAKVLARETAGFKAIPYVYDAAGNPVASVSFLDGNIQTHVGGNTVTVQSFVADVWYRVRVVVDTTAGTFDLFVDGVRMQHAQMLRMASASVTNLAYYLDGTGAGTLLVDNVKVYVEASFIGAPPAPVFDVRKYGATGDGTTKDTAAIQKAITAATGTGGSVLLTKGTYLSGTLTLGSKMTFFIDPSATLRGTTNVADYPTQTPPTGNTQLLNTQRALLYATNVTDLVIDGGGTIDGQGDAFGGVEGTRPVLVWTVLSQRLRFQNLYLMKGAVWGLVNMENDHVLIRNVNLQSNFITHDGLDVVDGSDITVDDCAISSGDDAMCPKSGVRRGIDGLVVKNSIFSGNGTSGGSNGIKFGTATYGTIKNATIVDDYVKNVQYAAMAVESRHGSDVHDVSFQRIEFANVGSAFFVYLAQQDTTHPASDVPKLGSIDRVSFTDIRGSTSSWGNSPHQGSLITGHIFNGTTYPLTNLSFTNAAISFIGGLGNVPADPVEAMPNQYPESNMFGDLPAWGYYLRHVSGVTFTNCTTSVVNADARQKLVTTDVSGLVGMP